MIRAVFYPPDQSAAFDANRLPGSFMLIPRQMAGLFELDFFCPCGCGLRNRLLIGKDHKPGGPRPSWRWNGSMTAPTLAPAVHQEGHWHGWLQHGCWRVE